MRGRHGASCWTDIGRVQDLHWTFEVDASAHWTAVGLSLQPHGDLTPEAGGGELATKMFTSEMFHLCKETNTAGRPQGAAILKTQFSEGTWQLPLDMLALCGTSTGPSKWTHQRTGPQWDYPCNLTGT